MCFWNLILVNMGRTLCDLQYEQLKTKFKFPPSGVASGAVLLCVYICTHTIMESASSYPKDKNTPDGTSNTNCSVNLVYNKKNQKVWIKCFG